MSFNALNIDFYLCGGIHSKGYAPGEQTTALLQELTAILDRLKSDDYEPNLHTIWLSAKRPTFRQYYEHYYPETPYDIVDAETEKNARRAYTIAYPCAEVWYQMSTNHFPGENGQEVYVLCLNDVKVFGTKNPTDCRCREDTELLRWAMEGARKFVSAVERGTYQKEFLNRIAYPYREGWIKRKELWAVCPELRRRFLAPLTKRDIAKFMKTYNMVGKSAAAPLKNMTARVYYEACAALYEAWGLHGDSAFTDSESEHEHYGENKPTPKERYYAIAGDEDNGLKNVPMDDPEAFREWHRRRGPFFRKGKSSTAYGVVVPSLNGNLTVELIPVTDDDAKSGWRFIIFADFSSYTILAANALCDAGYPIQVGEPEVFFCMLTGDDDVEIVPAWEPASPFSIHLPPGAVGKAVAEKATWKNDCYETKRDTAE